MKRYFSIVCFLAFQLIISAQDNSDILMRARAMIDQGKATDAISLLSGMSSSGDIRIWLMLADARVNTGDYQGAAGDFNKANYLAPGSGEYGLSRISALKGDVKNSLAHLEQNIKSQFRKSEKEILLDPAYAVIENSPEWRSFWKTERYSFPDRKISEIEYYVTTGNREEAMNVLDDLRSQYQGEDQTMYATALVDYSLQKYSEAMTILAKLIPEDKTNERYLRLMANVQTSQGNPAGASDTYTSMLNSGVNDASILLKRAECYRKTGETDKAIKDLDRFLSMYPDNRDALSQTGKLLSETGDNLKAIDYYSKNLKLHPNDPQCYIDRANSYFTARSWEYAVKDYSMALDLKPDSPDVWLNKGISLLNSGDKDDACHDFRKALSLGNKKAATYISSNCIK